MVRDALRADLPAIESIYSHYVRTSTCTFQLEPGTLAERLAWFEGHGPRHPVLVAETDEGVLGWGSLSPYNLRGGYARTVELSVYVRHHRVVSGVSADQDASLALHRAFGFREAGRLHEVGFKHGLWLDVVYLELPL
jgi:L-amino acid N-acyltransferase